MSTWMYLECRDHDPRVTAEDESGQHFYDLPRIRAEIEVRADLVRQWDLMEEQQLAFSSFQRNFGYFPMASIRFLREHRTCRDIGIRDEYGIDRTKEEES